jgi:acetoacetyl-CoA synthetase
MDHDRTPSSSGPNPSARKPFETFRRSCVLTKYAAFLEETFSPGLARHDYDQLHSWSVDNPAQFWASLMLFCELKMSGGFQHGRPRSIPEEQVFRRSLQRAGKPQLVDVEWFPGIQLNVAENILAYAETHPSKIALVSYPENHEDDFAYRVEKTFSELLTDVTALANFLVESGVQAGQVVAAVLPNEISAIVAFLATNSVGAVFASCAPDLGAMAVTDRLAQLSPAALFVMESAGYWYKGKWQHTRERTETFVSQLSSVTVVIACPLCNGPSTREREDGQYDFSYVRLHDVLMRKGSTCKLSFRRISFQEPVCILFTSGTTGTPKAIVHGNGIFLNHLKEHRLHLNQNVDSVVLQYTSLSWMMFNHMVSSLATGCKLILYEGAALPPCDPLRLLRISKKEKVSHLGISPGLLLGYSKLENDAMGELGESPFIHLSVLMVTGAPSTVKHFNYVANNMGSHIAYVSMSGGTDICGCFVLGCPGWISVTPPRITRAGLGMNVQCLDGAGRRQLGPESEGELCCSSVTPVYPLHFVGDTSHVRYKAAYFQRFGDSMWCHGDSAVEFDRSDGGGFIILGRSDLVMNVNGVRIGSADFYRVTERVSWVIDACAVGQAWAGDVRIVLILELAPGEVLSAERITEVRTTIRSNLSPRHVPSVIIAARIPYTFSGKRSETAAKNVLENRVVESERSLRNPESLAEIKRAMEVLNMCS